MGRVIAPSYFIARVLFKNLGKPDSFKKFFTTAANFYKPQVIQDSMAIKFGGSIEQEDWAGNKCF